MNQASFMGNMKNDPYLRVSEVQPLNQGKAFPSAEIQNDATTTEKSLNDKLETNTIRYGLSDDSH